MTHHTELLNHIAKEIIFYSPTGLFRVAETNDIYECGWIFISNELDIDSAIIVQEKYEKQCPHLSYRIVPVFKENNN